MSLPRWSLALAAGWSLAAAPAPVTAQQTKPPAPLEAPHFAPKFGITYRLVPYGRSYGALLVQEPVPGTGADRAGLQKGDIIVYVDNQPLYVARDIIRHGGKIKLAYIDVHDRQLKTTTAILPPLTGRYPPPRLPAPYVLGVSVSPVTLKGSDIPEPEPGDDPSAPALTSLQGLRIDGLALNSAARVAGLTSGDVLLSANGVKTEDLDNLRDALQNCQGVLTVTLKKGDDPTRITRLTIYPQPTGGPSVANPTTSARR